MTGTATRPTAPKRAMLHHPAAIIAAAVGITLLANVAIWLIGTAAGGSFDHIEDNGHLHTTTAPQGVISMTTIPMTIGLTLAVLIARTWPSIIRIAQVGGAAAALGTIAMTIDARFDTASTVALALMHVLIAASVVLALEAIRRRVSTRSV
jgi:hypothetical protein